MKDDVRKWVVGILGQVDNQTPTDIVRALVYAVTSALTSESELQQYKLAAQARVDELQQRLADVRKALGVKADGDIEAAVRSLKKKASVAHQKTVLERWSKAAPRKRRKRGAR